MLQLRKGCRHSLEDELGALALAVLTETDTDTAGRSQGLGSTGNPSVGSKRDHRGGREELEEGQRLGRGSPGACRARTCRCAELGLVATKSPGGSWLSHTG